MNKQENLLVILAEECSEISKDVCKALRFGLNSTYEGRFDEDNEKKIITEFNDLVAVMELLFGDVIDRNLISKKKEKIKKFENYQIQIGTLI